MFRPQNTQERILHRLKIARGHLDKVITMVAEQDYCIDVLHQSGVVQSVLKETDHVLLENHLKTCVVDHIKKGNIETSTEEIMSLGEWGKQYV